MRTDQTLGLVCIVLATLITPYTATPVLGQAGPLYGGTLKVALAGDPLYLTAAHTSLWDDFLVANQISEGLTNFGPGYAIMPSLAQSWGVSPDGLTYTFHLVQNATWHDGQPFTSADVKFTYEAYMDPKTGVETYARLAKVLQSVDAPDPYTCISPEPPIPRLFRCAYSPRTNLSQAPLRRNTP